MTYTFKVRSGFHVTRDANGNRVQVGKGETFTDDRPLHKGVLGDKIQLVESTDQSNSVTPTEEPELETVEPVLESDEDPSDDLGISKMTVAELKEYAEELELDTSSCKRKEDYVQLIEEAVADE